MKLTTFFVLSLAALLLVTPGRSSPRRGHGKSIQVVDADTFDVQLKEHDSRISEDLIRIKLGDIDCLETRSYEACISP